MLSTSRTLSGAPAMLPVAVSSAVAGRACTCSSRWVRRSTVSMSRVASSWPFPVWLSRALRRRSSWRQLSSRLLMRSRLSGSRGLSVPVCAASAARCRPVSPITAAEASSWASQSLAGGTSPAAGVGEGSGP